MESRERSAWIILALRLGRFLRNAIGTLYEWAGVPPFVRAGTYECSITGTRLRVRAYPHHTRMVVTTKDGEVDYFFSRILGEFDRTGVNGAECCTMSETAPESTLSSDPSSSARSS